MFFAHLNLVMKYAATAISGKRKKRTAVAAFPSLSAALVTNAMKNAHETIAYSVARYMKRKRYRNARLNSSYDAVVLGLHVRNVTDEVDSHKHADHETYERGVPLVNWPKNGHKYDDYAPELWCVALCGLPCALVG